MSAKRQSKIKNSASIDDAMPIFFGLGALGLVAANIQRFIPILVVLLIALLGWFFLHRAQKRKRVKNLYDRLIAAIGQHENALISYFHQSRREDQFGNIDESRWHANIDTFLRTKIVPEKDFVKWRQSSLGQQAAEMVHKKTLLLVEAHRVANPLASVEASSLTPLEYERHCAAIMQEAGWTIKMTPTTRDGGADFIAEKAGWRMVVQCKRYAQPVGNKAVQEVNSAVRLYNGNVACVVAPTGFTRQAQTEAHSLSVHLLHHSSLAAFANKIISEQ